MAQKISMQDIADRLGISKYAVSRALSGKDGVGEATRLEVTAMAAALGYRKRPEARHYNGSPGSARTCGEEADFGPQPKQPLVYIGMDESHASEPMFWRRVREGLVGGCSERGLAPRFFTFDETDDLLIAELEEGSKTEAALGIIAAGKCPSALLLRLQSAGLPLVLVDHEEPVLAADCVLNANVEAGRMACRHLSAQGCRSLAFVGELGFAVSFRERFWGCRLALDDLQEAWRARGREAASAAARNRPAYKDDLQLRRWAIPYGRRPWEPILDKKLAAAVAERALPDGFVCANDDIALKLLELLSRRGMDVPADCRVIGIDNTAAGQRAAIPLTTVDLAKERLGMRAVETLVRRCGHPEALPEKVVLSARLIVRQSG